MRKSMTAQPTFERPRAYRVADFCRAYGLSRSTTYNLMAEGKLRTIKIAGRRLIPADAAEALLKGEPA
jgi:excisionase family DNA binding protein